MTEGQEAPYTGAPISCATRAMALSRPASAMSFPATITVRPRSNRSSPAASSLTPAPTLENSMRLGGKTGGEPISSRIFIGSDKKTGPRGGDIEL